MLQFLLSFTSGLIITLLVFFAGYATAIYQVWLFERKQELEMAKLTNQKRNVKKNEKA